MDLIAIKKLGEELGHEGLELRNFVEEQQNKEKDKKRRERKD